MSQFFISCKESRIENNKSFYGCFYLGPFEPSQSITIANALRRTLLSELYGLGIVSVEIEGASHEYSSLPGVKDSVLDILLNLKEIVLKKTVKNFKPQIGYLKVRGPGVVRASHFRLPPFIQSVDPNQYIATLADNGFLNMKFIIQYGNKWLSPMNSLSGVYNQYLDNKKEEPKTLKKSDNAFNLHLKKRRLILKKLKQIGIASSNSYINMFSQFATRNEHEQATKNAKKINISKRGLNIVLTCSKKYPAVNLKGVPILKKLNKYIEKKQRVGTGINVGKTKKSNTKLKNYNFWTKERRINNVGNFDDMAKPCLTSPDAKHLAGQANLAFNKKTIFFNSNPLTIDAVFNPINKVNYIIEINDFKTAPKKMKTSVETSELYEMFNNTNSVDDLLAQPDVKHPASLQCPDILESSNLISEELESILDLKREINAFAEKKETLKHNITLEVWTNGSIHPRDALYESFKNLIKLFAKLKKINIFGEDSFYPLQGISDNKVVQTSVALKPLLKKIKMGEIPETFIQDLLPLNETSFLSTYVEPKLKDFYLFKKAKA
jgi:DNA-directed RNA polymerase alpha subunit